jgi:hypothetical protein
MDFFATGCGGAGTSGASHSEATAPPQTLEKVCDLTTRPECRAPQVALYTGVDGFCRDRGAAAPVQRRRKSGPAPANCTFMV